MRGDSKKRPDFFRAPSAIFGKLAEALVFVGGAAAFALAIASALKIEFGDARRYVKTISKLTAANQHAEKNWLGGKNGLRGGFLILLCRHSESVLEAFLMLSGRSDLVKVKNYRDA